MEEQWQVDRGRLRRLRQHHPDWSQTRLAQEIGRSLSWLKLSQMISGLLG